MLVITPVAPRMGQALTPSLRPASLWSTWVPGGTRTKIMRGRCTAYTSRRADERDTGWSGGVLGRQPTTHNWNSG